MRPEEQPEAPSVPWRAASSFVMGAVGLLCKGFLGLNRVETHGMEEFLRLLDEREDINKRERGLITGMRNTQRCSYSWMSNTCQYRTTSPCMYFYMPMRSRKFKIVRSHMANRMDDPILWGILPLSYMFNPDNHRWGLGSYDLCFTNKYALGSPQDAPTNQHAEVSPRSSLLDKSCLPTAQRIHRLAASSSRP
jgi:monolysocardiolipin acyltransferase